MRHSVKSSTSGSVFGPLIGSGELTSGVDRLPWDIQEKTRKRREVAVSEP